MIAIARRVALSVLEDLERSGETLDALIARALEKRPTLARRDRALITELVFGVVRWQGRLDWMIRQASNIPLKKIAPHILQILRLGLYQILFLSKVPGAVAVDESVKLAKKRAPRWVAGYVNGVLRTVSRTSKEIEFPDETVDPVLALSTRESYPPWLIKRWIKRMGFSEAMRLCQANNRIPPVTIRVNRLKASRSTLERALSPYVQEIRPALYTPDGLALKGIKRPIGTMTPFLDGWFQVQDEAAQMMSILLNPQPNEKVLDGCAGFGGKTGHIVQLMNNTGQVTAVDNHQVRLDALSKTMKRLGGCSVETLCHDMTNPFPQNLIGDYDRVLLDAPCSGLGVVRRNPDIKWRKKTDDLPVLAGRQGRLLKVVSSLVKKDGVLVYCVCSMEPEEGEKVVEGFLKTCGDFVIDDSFPFPDGWETFWSRPGFFKSLPHRHDVDGFFGVRLRRIKNECDRC